MKKQSVAYALALLLGATSVFGGAVLPSFEQDAAVVQAASPSVAQTNNPLRSASETTVTTVDDLNTALENGGEIKIDADIDSNTTFTVKEDSILNLNGHKISSYFLNVAEGKKLEITGTGDYEGIIEVGEYAGNPGTLILSDGNVQRIDVFSGSTFVMDGGIVNTNRQRKDAYEALSAAQNGTITYTAAISKGEQFIARTLHEQGFPLVVLLYDGFPEEGSPKERYYKPGGAYFEACSKGQLLLLEPTEQAFCSPVIRSATEETLHRKAESKHYAFTSIPATSQRYRFVALNEIGRRLATRK